MTFVDDFCHRVPIASAGATDLKIGCPESHCPGRSARTPNNISGDAQHVLDGVYRYQHVADEAGG